MKKVQNRLKVGIIFGVIALCGLLLFKKWKTGKESDVFVPATSAKSPSKNSASTQKSRLHRAPTENLLAKAKKLKPRSPQWNSAVMQLVENGSPEAQRGIIDLILYQPTQDDAAALIVYLSQVDKPILETIQICLELSDWSQENHIEKEQRNAIRKACGSMAARLDKEKAEIFIEKPLSLVEYPRRVPTDDLIEAIDVLGNARWTPATKKLLSLLEKPRPVTPKPHEVPSAVSSKLQSDDDGDRKIEVSAENEMRYERVQGAVVFALRFLASKQAEESLMQAAQSRDRVMTNIAKTAIRMRCEYLPEHCPDSLAKLK